MKKILLIPVLFCSFLMQSNAQVNVGIKGGVGLSFLDYSPSRNGPEIDDKKWMCVPSIHAIVSVPIGNAFSVRSGVGLNQQGFSYTEPGGGKVTARLSYLDIPLYISYKLPFLKRKLEILAGGSFGWNLGGQGKLENVFFTDPRNSYTGEVFVGEVPGWYTGSPDQGFYANEYNWSVLLGANYQLSKRFLLGAEAQLGLSNVLPHNYNGAYGFRTDEDQRVGSSDTRTYSLSVTYILWKGKKTE